MEDGLFRYRRHLKVTWLSNYGPGKPVNSIIGAKGLVPVLNVGDSEYHHIIIPDVAEIGGIEYLRKRRMFYEAVSLAHTHADFQGKRIIALLLKERILSNDEINNIKNICKKFKCKFNRIGRWSFICVIEVLNNLLEISKDEYNTLDELRDLRNKLQHSVAAKYGINTEQVDHLLLKIIQVLLRMRELPIGSDIKITGYEFETFWKDIGFGWATKQLE